jgi:CheY-like chemotaxis protein
MPLEKTILVVEDTADIRATLRHFLLLNGYRVAEASSGQEAVDFVEQQCPDLILMDLNMPHMDGLQATERIRQCREICQRVPIIAITAFDTYGMRDAALAAGCNDYLLKPIDLTQLEQTIRQILADDL